MLHFSKSNNSALVWQNIIIYIFMRTPWSESLESETKLYFSPSIESYHDFSRTYLWGTKEQITYEREVQNRFWQQIRSIQIESFSKIYTLSWFTFLYQKLFSLEKFRLHKTHFFSWKTIQKQELLWRKRQIYCSTSTRCLLFCDVGNFFREKSCIFSKCAKIPKKEDFF